MTFAEFIEENGTVTIASRLGIPNTQQVRLWKHRNKIPREQWPALLVAFPELKVDHLFEMSVASKSA